MCGIAGIIDFSFEKGLDDLRRMTAALNHRGPDGQGDEFCVHRHAAVSLGHTRLAILDLSANGRQPMSYRELSVVFNGEIYNFQELRSCLLGLGHSFQTKSDTEVLLHAFSQWGPGSFEKFVGMFAIGIVDKSNGKIYLVRDRLGVKPLHVYQRQDTLYFASELKAIIAGAGLTPDVNPTAVYHFFEKGVIPGDETVFRDCTKVEPGTYWEIDLSLRSIKRNTYWSAKDFYLQPKSADSFGDSADRLDDLLNSACRYRMVSDVPVGMFLSGGYDSGAVAAIVQRHSSKPINTFTIGFNEGNNEAAAAARVASHIGSNHHELYCTPESAREILHDLPGIFDEPFGDSSAIPTVLVSRLARKSVKVALSADGGDELFGGYASYIKLQRAYQRLSATPQILKTVFRHAAKRLNPILLRSSSRPVHLFNVLLASLGQNDCETCTALHAQSQSLPGFLLRGLLTNDFREQVSNQVPPSLPKLGYLESAMLQDTLSYLPDDILVKVDRATMSTGLEGREPLLDHRLLEFAAKLPIGHKIGPNHGKLILREVAHRYLPSSIMQRPKTGFSIPILKWLRHELSDMLEDNCSPMSLSRHGLFDVDFVQRKLQQFRTGQLYYTQLIWRIFVFQQWATRWLS